MKLRLYAICCLGTLIGTFGCATRSEQPVSTAAPSARPWSELILLIREALPILASTVETSSIRQRSLLETLPARSDL